MIKRFLLYFFIFAFLFCSCDLQIEGDDSDDVTNPINVPPRKFWAQNIENDSFYQVTADLMAESKNCRVWAERGVGVSIATATSMAKAYEDNILPKMLNTFGINVKVEDEEGQVITYNTMEFADYLGDVDGKLCILLLDIRDGYKLGVNNATVAGYFWAGNFFDNIQHSNQCDMIYIDTYPGRPGTTESNATFAHEMQHMMNFVTSIVTRSIYNPMDLWVDEGLASAAEWLITGSHPEYRWTWYNQDPSGLIKNGNNFFVWGNREKENQYALLDDYSTVYLFFQWLRLQAGRSDIYLNIISSNDYDYRAVTKAADKYMAGNNYGDWPTLLRTWLAANYINAPSGSYGYRNDGTLKNIRAKTMPAGVKNVSLFPGEGVYSMTDNYVMPSRKQNIRYAGLNKAGNALSDSSTFSGGALLTYNANTNNKSESESGTTTGVASYGMADIDASARSTFGSMLIEVGFSGPFVIGAGDMLRRNGFEEKPFFELTQPMKGITLFE